MSHGRLLYVVGPSGAGKDSLIKRLQSESRLQGQIYLVKRLVDRPTHESTPLDEYLSADDFQAAINKKSLAMYWQANQHQYGITHTEMAQAKRHSISVINGSRAYIADLKKEFPGVEVVHITANESIIKERLKSRKREDSNQIELRVERSQALSHLDHLYDKEICNDSSIDIAFAQLLHYIHHRI